MTQKIFGELVHEGQRGWDAFESHLPHRRYHDPDVTATPAPEAPMSIASDIKTGLHDLAVKAEALDEDAIGKLEKLQTNAGAMSLFDAALKFLGLPEDAFQVAIDALGSVAKLYDNPEGSAPAAPAPADPAMGAQPEPAPAG